MNTQFTNNDIFNLLIGGSIFTIGYLFDKALSKEANTYFTIKQNIQKWRKQSTYYNPYDRLLRKRNAAVRDGISAEDIKQYVVMEKFLPSYANDTLKLRIRELPLHIDKPEYFDHVTGGNFHFFYMGKTVNAQINDTKIMSSILTQRATKVAFFGHMDPVVKSTEYYLKKGTTIALVGALSYDLSNNKFNIEPMIMGHSITQIIQHYHDLYIISVLPRFFTFLLTGLGIWLMWKPIKKLVHKLRQLLPWKLRQDPRKDQALFFKNEVQLKTRKQQVYICQRCNINNTNIAYRCGHISICEECHNAYAYVNGGRFMCPTCGLASGSFIKIYFG